MSADIGSKINGFRVRIHFLCLAFASLISFGLSYFSEYTVDKINSNQSKVLNSLTEGKLITIIVFVSIILAVIGLIIVGALCSKAISLSSGAGVILSIVSVAIIIAGCVSLVVNFSNGIRSLNETYGLISVSSYDELLYVKKFPNLNFQLENDIVAEDGTQWKTIKTFKGSLEGNGHKITNLHFNKTGFVKKNEGTINNLIMKNYICDKNPTNKNFGVIAKENDGQITNCKIISKSKEKSKREVLVAINNGISENNNDKSNSYCDGNNHEFECKKAVKATFFKKGYKELKCKKCGFKYQSVEVFMLKQKLFMVLMILVVLILTVIFIV